MNRSERETDALNLFNSPLLNLTCQSCCFPLHPFSLSFSFLGSLLPSSLPFLFLLFLVIPLSFSYLSLLVGITVMIRYMLYTYLVFKFYFVSTIMIDWQYTFHLIFGEWRRTSSWGWEWDQYDSLPGPPSLLVEFIECRATCDKHLVDTVNYVKLYRTL